MYFLMHEKTFVDLVNLMTFVLNYVLDNAIICCVLAFAMTFEFQCTCRVHINLVGLLCEFIAYSQLC